MMSAMRQLILIGVVATALIALAAVGLRMGLLPAPAGLHVADGPPTVRGVLTLGFIPAWLLGAWAIAEARQRRRKVRPAEDYQRIFLRSYAAMSAFVVVAQLWFATIVTTGSAPGRELMLRLSVVFFGSVLAFQGNFIAKSSPPTGEGAPAPERWTRHAMRTGWVMVGIGIALVVLGFTVHVRWATLSMVAATALLVVNGVTSRRAMRAA